MNKWQFAAIIAGFVAGGVFVGWVTYLLLIISLPRPGRAAPGMAAIVGLTVARLLIFGAGVYLAIIVGVGIWMLAAYMAGFIIGRRISMSAEQRRAPPAKSPEV